MMGGGGFDPRFDGAMGGMLPGMADMMMGRGMGGGADLQMGSGAMGGMLGGGADMGAFGGAGRRGMPRRGGGMPMRGGGRGGGFRGAGLGQGGDPLPEDIAFGGHDDID